MLIPIDRPIIDARNMAVAKEHYISSDGLEINHENKAVVLIHISNIGTHTATIAGGIRKGQQLTLRVVAAGMARALRIENAGNMSLRGDWFMATTTDAWLALIWSGSVWVEVARNDGQGIDESGIAAKAHGLGNIVSGNYSHASGENGTVSGRYSSLSGNSGLVSSDYSVGSGFRPYIEHTAQWGHSFEPSCQRIMHGLNGNTYNATPTELALGFEAEKCTLLWSGLNLAATITVVGANTTGTVGCMFKRMALIHRENNTTALIGAVKTIGEDIKSDAGLDVVIDADDANESLRVKVIGLAGVSIKWFAVLDFLELYY